MANIAACDATGHLGEMVPSICSILIDRAGEAAPASGGNTYDLAKGCCVSLAMDEVVEGINFHAIRQALGGRDAGVKFLNFPTVCPGGACMHHPLHNCKPHASSCRHQGFAMRVMPPHDMRDVRRCAIWKVTS